MSRRSRFRSLLAMLLAFCLVSASLWSVSAEAVADALSEDIRIIDIGSAAKHAPADKHCKQGCHAQSLLMALNCAVASASLPFVGDVPQTDCRVIVPSHPQDGPFRPPRHASQA